MASTAERLFPFPCRFFQRPDPETATGVRSAYPADVMTTASGGRAIDFSAFNDADGHSPAALVHFGVDVAPRFPVDQRHTPVSLAADAPTRCSTWRRDLQQAFRVFVQARFDGCDGLDLGRLLYREPVAGMPADRRVVLLEAIGDCQVPNLTTRMLARAVGVGLLSPPVEAVFGPAGGQGADDPPGAGADAEAAAALPGAG